jgi:hypothetical protein
MSDKAQILKVQSGDDMLYLRIDGASDEEILARIKELREKADLYRDEVLACAAAKH